jgi:hypothetical protein
MNENIEKIVDKLNDNLPDESMFGFGYTYTPFWESIDLYYMSNTIPLWNSEEGEEECTYTIILGKLQKVVIELMDISQLSKLMKEILSRNYTDLLMLEDESWQPDNDSINASISNIQEIESIFEIDLKDTRE